jgi:diguanylate cyclase (GGDEF)-like protein
LPSVAVKVLDLCQRENLDLPAIAKVISNDPALVAKILKTVNSPAFALRQEVRTVSHAVALLGVNSVRTLVLSFSLLRDVRKGQRAALTNYWKRSVVAALCARELASVLKFAYREEAFLVALLQDIGILALRQLGEPVYNDLLESAGWDHDRLVSGEQVAFDCDHAEVGAWLAARWRLPERFCQAVGYSHKPWRFEGDASGDMSTLVKISALAGSVADIWIRPDATGAAQRAHIECSKTFRGSGILLEEVVKNVSAALPEIASLFEIDLGSHERTQEVLAEAQEALAGATVPNAPIKFKPPAPNSPASIARKITERDLATDLPVGGAAAQYMDEQFLLASQQGEPLSVIMAEVDNWRALTDRLGEKASAALLRSIAPCMSNRLRKKDLVARCSDGEFLFVLPETNADGAEVVAERARMMVASQMHSTLGGASVAVTMSFGCATLLEGSSPSAADLTAMADHALYAARAAGGNRTATAERTAASIVRSSPSLH